MRTLVEETLKALGCYSPNGTDLVLGTIAQESAYGRYRRQLGGGPALGIAQMEPRTFYDIDINFFRYHRDIKERVMFASGVQALVAEELEHNDRLAICMCRMQYYRYPDRLPSRIPDYARLWKLRYNTIYGAGTEEEFIQNFQRYVIPDTPVV